VRKLSLALLALAASPLAASTAHAQGDVGGAATDSRPAPMTVGIGIGTGVGAAGITTPNIGSVRLVLAPNLMLEPQVTIDRAGGSMEAGGTTMDKPATNTFGVGAQVRFLLAGRGPVDLSGIGGLAFGYKGSSQEINTTTNSMSNTAITVNWGLGLSYYFAHVWSLSLDVTNDLFGWSKASTESKMGGTTASTSNTDYHVGINFQPLTRLLLHLYF
jgi:hypothetical protein